MVLEQLDIHMLKKKMNLDIDFMLIMKIYSEWIIDLKAKCKSIKHLDNNRGLKPIQP